MKREAWALAVAAFLMLLVLAPQVSAQSSRLSLTLCEMANIDWTSGRSWQDSAGISHFRDLVWTSTFQGEFGDGTEFTGAGSGLLSLNWDQSYTGDLGGAFRWTFYGFRDDATFSGRFSGTSVAGVLSDDGVAHAGVMTLLGHGQTGTDACPAGAGYWTGTILMPHG